MSKKQFPVPDTIARDEVCQANVYKQPMMRRLTNSSIY